MATEVFGTIDHDFKIREKIKELDRPVGHRGAAVLAAHTDQEFHYATGLRGRNMVINGSCMVDQRNEGASVSGQGGGYQTIDRFEIDASNANSFSYDRRGQSESPPGFSNSFRIETISSFTRTSYQFIRHNIEGKNCAHLQWGTANAQDACLQFWFKSNFGGIHNVVISNNANNRAYVIEFDVPNNEWVHVVKRIPGDTGGTWPTDSSTGIRIKFNLGSSSSTYATNPSGWVGSDKAITERNVSISERTGAYIQFTGLQFEHGPVPTPFEYRTYAEELALCQRYFQMVAHGRNGSDYVGTLHKWNSTNTFVFFDLPVEMRAQPTLVKSSGSGDFEFKNAGYTSSGNDLTIDGDSSAQRIRLNSAVTNGNWPQGSSGWVRVISNISAYLALSSEI